MESEREGLQEAEEVDPETSTDEAGDELTAQDEPSERGLWVLALGDPVAFRRELASTMKALGHSEASTWGAALDATEAGSGVIWLPPSPTSHPSDVGVAVARLSRAEAEAVARLAGVTRLLVGGDRTTWLLELDSPDDFWDGARGALPGAALDREVRLEPGPPPEPSSACWLTAETPSVVRAFLDAGKLVAVLALGGWTRIELEGEQTVLAEPAGVDAP